MSQRNVWIVNFLLLPVIIDPFPSLILYYIAFPEISLALWSIYLHVTFDYHNMTQQNWNLTAWNYRKLFQIYFRWLQIHTVHSEIYSVDFAFICFMTKVIHVTWRSWRWVVDIMPQLPLISRGKVPQYQL